MNGADIARLLSVVILGAALITGNIIAGRLLMASFPVPYELWGLLATKLGAVVYIARSIGGVDRDQMRTAMEGLQLGQANSKEKIGEIHSLVNSQKTTLEDRILALEQLLRDAVAREKKV